MKAFLTRRIRIPKFDDEDEDDDSERKKLQIKIRKAVYKEVIKEPNGKLSVSHLILEPRGQAGLPIQVKKDEVIGFCWKELYNVRFWPGFDRRAACCSAAFSR